MKNLSACLILAVLTPGGVSMPAAPAPPPAQKKPATAAVPLFVGQDTAPWLPKVTTLPKAAEVESRAQKLSSRVRNVDPFGVATFPREESLPVIVEEDPARPTPKLTLNQALQTLKLNAVNLEKKEFVLGARSVFEGDVIELSFRNEIFRALVVEVGATEVVFRDLDREETGIMPHSVVRGLKLEPMQISPSRLDPHLAPMEPRSLNSP